MKKTKIINKFLQIFILLFVIVLTTISFSACAQVRAMTITNEDDSIDELVTVSLDVASVLSAGYNVENMKAEIETVSIGVATSMKEELNDKIIRDKVLATRETREILNSFLDGIDVVKSAWEKNTFAIGIRFKNIDVYKYYYDITQETKKEMQTEKHFFYDKIYYYSSTMYVKHNALYNRLNLHFSTTYPNLINSTSNGLLYSYKTSQRRQHSDADFITKQNGEYYHTWVVDPNNLEEPIMLYYNVANPESYIIIALAVTGGVVVILGATAGIIELIKKKKGATNHSA